MPIGVQCADCGRQYQADDSLAGSRLRCVGCGSMIPIPGAPPGEKVCVVCGKDLWFEERTSDPQGNYYCQPCWNASLLAYSALPARAQARQTMAVIRATAEIRGLGAAQRRSELAALVTTTFNTHRSWKFKLALVLLILGGFIAGWYLRLAAVVLGSALVVVGACLVAFYCIWELGLPFQDGWQIGKSCCLSPTRRRAWMDRHREYRIRQPWRVIVTGLLFVVLATLAFHLASTHTRPPGPATPSRTSPKPPPAAAPSALSAIPRIEPPRLRRAAFRLKNAGAMFTLA